MCEFMHHSKCMWNKWHHALNLPVYSWVSLGYFAVNPSGGQLKMYWWLRCPGVKNLTKLHKFAAKHKVNTYSEKLFPSDDCALIWSWPPSEIMTSRETQGLVWKKIRSVENFNPTKILIAVSRKFY